MVSRWRRAGSSDPAWDGPEGPSLRRNSALARRQRDLVERRRATGASRRATRTRRDLRAAACRARVSGDGGCGRLSSSGVLTSRGQIEQARTPLPRSSALICCVRPRRPNFDAHVGGAGEIARDLADIGVDVDDRAGPALPHAREETRARSSRRRGGWSPAPRASRRATASKLRCGTLMPAELTSTSTVAEALEHSRPSRPRHPARSRRTGTSRSTRGLPSRRARPFRRALLPAGPPGRPATPPLRT